MVRLFRYFLLLSIVKNLKTPIGCLLWSIQQKEYDDGSSSTKGDNIVL